MVREIVIALATAGTLWSSANAATSEEDRPRHRSAQAALRHFESIPDANFDEFLRQLRRPAPSAMQRAMVINTLPEQGELKPTAKEEAKLQRIGSVLAFHGRERDMELRLFTIGGLAFVGLHARTVLLITREALELLTTDELLSVIAHELGHDYVWDEYQVAQQRRNYGRLQELELWCDGIAVITLHRLGVLTESLVSATAKLARYNESIKGTPIDERYVPLDQRIRFIRAVARLMATAREANAVCWCDRLPVAGCTG